MGELLAIGEFSARCGLSAKMLRSYAAIGLLSPTAVDGSSGYRYYSAQQLPKAGVIALLRRAGVSVDDLARFFAQPDADQLDRWESEIVRASSFRREALAEARAALAMERVPASTAIQATTKGVQMTSAHATGTATHIGGRDTNEDCTLVSDRLFAVADGMGGHEGGEVASRLALDTLDAAFSADPSMSGLLEGSRRANQAVWRQATASGEDSIMGTTLAALAITSDLAAVVLHVGDSRLYRLRHGALVQLTGDHSVVAELVAAGELTEEESKAHPHRHVLTRAIGVGPDVEVDYAGVSCKPGDRLMLCTDGVFNALPPQQLKAILQSEADPQEAADKLIGKAVERSAEDNVSVVIVDVS